MEIEYTGGSGWAASQRMGPRPNEALTAAARKALDVGAQGEGAAALAVKSLLSGRSLEELGGPEVQAELAWRREQEDDKRQRDEDRRMTAEWQRDIDERLTRLGRFAS